MLAAGLPLILTAVILSITKFPLSSTLPKGMSTVLPRILWFHWVCVTWDADFRFSNQDWGYYQFRGTNWQKIKDKQNMAYLKNTYRVLLTRARQGLVVFIPKGDENDPTRKPLFYDETYEYLKQLGLKEVIW
jgi:hypothetical protein